MCTSILNPWTSVNFSQTIAPVDVSTIYSLSPKALSKIELRILPEPFHGDPDANVYLLNGNPGLNPLDLTFVGNTVMQTAFSGIYTHSLLDFLWIQSPCTIINGHGQPHLAYDWWKKRLSQILKSCQTPKLFCVELFPYHTKNIFSFPALPSDAYANSLILDAMRKNKLIIIMRGQKGWIKRIPALASYSSCITLNTPRCAYVTVNNTSKSGMSWNRIISYF